MDLSGTTVLVTGANRGIGRAIAERIAKEPVGEVLLGARDTTKVQPLGNGRAVTVDLSSRESIEASIADLPPVDVLVNNAGLMTGGLLEEQPLDDIYAMFQVNLVAVAHLTAKLLPACSSAAAA